MAWRRRGNKSLSNPMVLYITDAYMRHASSMSQDNENKQLSIYKWKMRGNMSSNK